MNAYVLYFFKANLSIGVVYLIYWFFLRKISSYKWNRFYLLFGIISSLMLPLIHFPETIAKNASIELELMPYTPSTNSELYVANISVGFFDNYWNVVFLFAGIGVSFFFIRFIIRCISLIHMVNTSLPYEMNKKIRVRQTQKQIIPFSFLNTIYINPAFLTDQELDKIMIHECTHVKQLHTIDILSAELLSVFLWYNPFSWLLKNKVKQNLEYIADDAVVKQGYKIQDYQLTLLKVNIAPSTSFPVNYFTKKQFKNRLFMMNKQKSSAKKLIIIYSFVLPVFFTMLCAFNNGSNKVNPKWHAHGTSEYANDELTVYINKEGTAKIRGKNGIFILRKVNDIIFEDYPNARLLVNGKKYPIREFKSLIDHSKIKVICAYFGFYAKKNFDLNELNAIVTVEYN